MENEDDRYRQARRRVRMLRGFYIHLTVYVVVNTGLFTLNTLVGRPFWFFWPMVGWGIGLAAHGLSVVGWRFLGSEWEERKIREHLDRERK